MYCNFLDHFLCSINRLRYLSRIIYKYDVEAAKFIVTYNSKKVSLAHRYLKIYIFLLFTSLLNGFKESSTLQKMLCIGFFSYRLGVYFTFLIVAEEDVLQSSVCLLNKMLRFEKNFSQREKKGSYHTQLYGS